MLATEFGKKIKDTVESISTDETDLEVKKELTTADLVVSVPASISSAGEMLVKITKVDKASDADSVVKPEMEIKNEDSTTEVPAWTQSTTNQSGSVDGADSTDSARIMQIRELFGQNMEKLQN